MSRKANRKLFRRHLITLANRELLRQRRRAQKSKKKCVSENKKKKKNEANAGASQAHQSGFGWSMITPSSMTNAISLAGVT